MANGYGMTAALAQLVLEATLTGATLSFSTVCVQLHAGGSPGTDGTSNPAAETNRQQITASVTGTAVTLGAAGPSWTIVATAGEDLSAVSVWNGFEDDPSAICLYTLPVTPNVTVAYGDVVTLTTLDLSTLTAALAS